MTYSVGLILRVNNIIFFLNNIAVCLQIQVQPLIGRGFTNISLLILYIDELSSELIKDQD